MEFLPFLYLFYDFILSPVNLIYAHCQDAPISHLSQDRSNTMMGIWNLISQENATKLQANSMNAKAPPCLFIYSTKTPLPTLWKRPKMRRGLFCSRPFLKILLKVSFSALHKQHYVPVTMGMSPCWSAYTHIWMYIHSHFYISHVITFVIYYVSALRSYLCGEQEHGLKIKVPEFQVAIPAESLQVTLPPLSSTWAR